MRIIFSRKGFDSANGGVASPIFPDGRLCSLPVPSTGDRTRFEDIWFGKNNLGYLVEDLTFNRGSGRSRVKKNRGCHLDPDLRHGALARKRGWLPAFGQAGAAATHLREKGVGRDDMFLFFGWFRRVIIRDGRFRYQPESPNEHVIFGWLQVGDIYTPLPSAAKLPEWAESHPHVSYSDFPFYALMGYVQRNSIYVAKKRLDLPGLSAKLPGAGVFKKYHECPRLTWPGKSRGQWRLPSWMHPFGKRNREPLSYHGDKDRWERRGNWVLLDTADIGQEFVLDCEEYPSKMLKRWLSRIFRHAR